MAEAVVAVVAEVVVVVEVAAGRMALVDWRWVLSQVLRLRTPLPIAVIAAGAAQTATAGAITAMKKAGAKAAGCTQITVKSWNDSKNPHQLKP